MNSASPRPSWDEMHFRLVSLWDIMKKFRAAEIIDGLALFSSTRSKWEREKQPQLFEPLAHREISRRAHDLETALSELGAAPISAAAAKGFLERLEQAETMPNGYRRLSGQNLASSLGHVALLVEVLGSELRARPVLVLSEEAAKLYEPKSPLFGSDADLKFKKKARLEISEAGKCLGLERWTACVFHLMRAVEVALEAARCCLQLKPPTKGQHKAWGAAVQAIKDEIDNREKLTHKRQWSSLADKKFFEEIHMALVSIKDGCRDDTMHVESTYTKDEAEHLFALTKGFIQKVASRLDEDGQPFA